MADARYVDPTPDDSCVTSEEIRSASEVLWDMASEEEDAEVKDYLQDLALKWRHFQSNAIYGGLSPHKFFLLFENPLLCRGFRLA